MQERNVQYSSRHQSHKGSKSKDKVIVLTMTDRLSNVRLAEFDDDS